MGLGSEVPGVAGVGLGSEVGVAGVGLGSEVPQKIYFMPYANSFQTLKRTCKSQIYSSHIIINFCCIYVFKIL